MTGLTARNAYVFHSRQNFDAIVFKTFSVHSHLVFVTRKTVKFIYQNVIPSTFIETLLANMLEYFKQEQDRYKKKLFQIVNYFSFYYQTHLTNTVLTIIIGIALIGTIKTRRV